MFEGGHRVFRPFGTAASMGDRERTLKAEERSYVSR